MKLIFNNFVRIIFIKIRLKSFINYTILINDNTWQIQRENTNYVVKNGFDHYYLIIS